ncbi:hypothetical protein VYU27_009574, partial [Nannochloropsis oceanica]
MSPALFEPLKEALIEAAGEKGLDLGPIRAGDLAKLTGDLQQFMEDEFGVTAKQQGKEWLMTRIPARLFRDYSPKGPLFTILFAAYSQKALLQWRSFNFEAKGGIKREENVALFLALQRALQDEEGEGEEEGEGGGKWGPPVVVFDASVPQRVRDGLRKAVEKHGGVVLEEEGEKEVEGGRKGGRKGG